MKKKNKSSGFHKKKISLQDFTKKKKSSRFHKKKKSLQDFTNDWCTLKDFKFSK